MAAISAPLLGSIPLLAMQFLNDSRGNLMQNPVLVENGNTYERADIMRGDIPGYNQDSHMVTNYAIKNIINAIQTVDQDALDLALTCSISSDFFVDPVICSGDGHTYSRKDLEMWFVTPAGRATMLSPMTRASCGERIKNKTLIDFMTHCSMQPMRSVGSSTKNVSVNILKKVVSKMLDTSPGAREYSDETKQFVLMYLINQLEFHHPTPETRTFLSKGVELLRRELRHGMGGYKSKSKLNKHKHSRSHKHSRKRG